ncbi:MAG: DUF2911 domain-containing protein [Myxococcales bacterium]|nr:DUF2911 domain-containing protein [Myxococcales bacterium]MCB9553314.1 DUF2911 domain-containing protein [Myxococcales bacterium]
MSRPLARFVLAAALCAGTPALAQSLDLPAPSPKAQVMQTVGVTPITVTWSSPGAKGRTVYGELVPFGELWRTGANAATTIEFGTDVTVGGQKVPAGKYAIFTIPTADKWTVILNKNANQGGTREYDQKLDAARFEVTPSDAPARERLTFVFSDTTDDATRLDLEWAGKRVSIPIQIATGELVAGGITGYSKASARTLANAARYWKDQKQYDKALALIDAALALDESWFALWIKADTLAAKGDKKAALPVAEKAYALGKKDSYFFWEQQIAAAIKDWKGGKK